MTAYNAALWTLVASAGLTIVFAAVFLARRDDGLRLRTLLILDYGVTYVVSGFAHVMEISTSSGFYNSRPGDMQGDSLGVTVAAVTTPIGLVFLACGLCVRWTKDRRIVPATAQYSLAQRHPVIAFLIGISVTLAAGIASVIVRSRVAVNDVGERVIGVDGGLARYAFLSSWLPWGLIVLTLVLLIRRRGLGAEVYNSVVVAGAVGAIAVATSWTGGRVDLVVFGVPLLVVLLPWLPRLRVPLLVVGAVAVTAIVRVQTLGRVGNHGFDLWSLADWQWGRFSMVSWAGNYVDVHGLLMGETLQRGYLIVPLSILHLLGVPTPAAGRSIVEVSGADFLGSDQFIHIVPGMTAELYVNFGYLGVAAGYLVLGFFGSFVADRYRRASTELSRALWAYCAMLCVFQTVNAQSAALTPLVLMTGAPLFGLVAAERVWRHFTERARPPRGLGNPEQQAPHAALPRS